MGCHDIILIPPPTRGDRLLSRHRVWAVALVAATLASGCTSSSTTSTHSKAVTSTTNVPIEQGASPTPVAGVVSSVALSGSTAWAVIRPESDSPTPSIWAFHPGEKPVEVVAATELQDSDQVAVVPAADGFAVLIEACSRSSSSGVCVRDSGSVQLRGTDGAVRATVAVWTDADAETQGGLPGHLGLEGDRLWVTRHDAALAIDPAGKVVEPVPVEAADTQCLVDGMLTNIDIDDPNLDQDEHPPGPLDELTAVTMTVTRWTGDTWSTPDGASTDVPPLPEVHCGDDRVTVWNGNRPTNSWSAAGGWRSIAAADDPTDASDVRWTDSGAAFTVDARGALQRIDPTTGTVTDTDLEFDLPKGETPIGFAVAETDTQVFACAGRSVFDGVKGSPAAPGTTCGFTARPTS